MIERAIVAAPAADSSPDRPAGPSSAHELDLRRAGFRSIAGVDEVGRGCIAGPVVAAAVVLPDECLRDLSVLAGVRDSKATLASERAGLYDRIVGCALAVAVGSVDADDIDRIGIAPATRLAMARAIAALATSPDHLLIDYVRLGELPLAQTSIVRGDALCLSIAAASIVAKVTRDRLLTVAHDEFPAYGFARHKGYGTPEHLLALRSHGACCLHRRSFAPVRDLMLAPAEQMAPVASSLEAAGVAAG